MTSDGIVNFNVGGRKFSTSRNTLLGSGNSFFSVLINGQIPSLKDETGAYFIDRDPAVFGTILNYLRTNEINTSLIDPSSLKNEAEFYGLDSLVKKLSLCEEVFNGTCGDLLFNAYIPSPSFVSERNGPWSSCTLSADNRPSTAGSEHVPQLSSFGHTSRICSSSAGYKATSSTDGPINVTKPVDSDPSTLPSKQMIKPVTLITCHNNLMAVAYDDCVGVFSLRNPIGWHLIWLSPCLRSGVNRLAITSSPAITQSCSGSPISTNTPGFQGSTSISVTAASNLPFSPQVQQNAVGTSSLSSVLSSASGGFLVAASTGCIITLWFLCPPSGAASAVASCGGCLGVVGFHPTYQLASLTPEYHHLAENADSNRKFICPLARSKEPWKSELIGEYNLNGRAVDYLFFIGVHLVALSRRGLVGVRHMMSNSWQVWSTVPICSYGVAGLELLVLGCANGRICSINIQKFPLRIADNDLLVTEIFRDPQRDPITALSVHLISQSSGHAYRRCIEIAYGTLSGRVCLIVQYPENVAYSPQLLQTFSAHRAMVTRVVLSDKHLISVCNEFNHVRTWVVTRFRDIISTQPGSIPLASFHITALGLRNPQYLTDSVLNAVRRCGHTNTNNDLAVEPSPITARVQFTLVRSDDMQRGFDPTSSTELSQQQPFRLPTQTHRFPTWRKRYYRSRSPGSMSASPQGTSDPQPNTTSVYQSVIVGSTSSTMHLPTNATITSDSSLPIRQDNRMCDARSPNLGEKNDIVVLPRTSWLHEDVGIASSRSSSVMGSFPGGSCNKPETSDGQMYSVCCEDGAVSRDSPGDMLVLDASLLASQLHELESSSSAKQQQRTSNKSSLFPNHYPTTSVGTSHPSPCIDLHQYANDPGPHGDREDVLVFVQKLTPYANQLFVRLASNGKRVCTITSVDDTAPISSFYVHDHDGSSGVRAHPRRFIFSGHTNGAIQVWDLTTALNQNKFTSMSGFGTANGDVSLTGGAVPGFGVDYGWIGNHVESISSTSMQRNSGGPTTRELLQLLATCQLATSNSTDSFAGGSLNRSTTT